MKPPNILLTHPFEMAIAVVLLLSGLRAIINQEALPDSIDHLPVIFGIVYRGLLAFSGGLILAGLILRTGVGPALELAGLWLAGTVFGVYGFAAVYLGISPAATIFAATMLSVAAACGLRAWAISREQRATGYVIREAKRQGGRDE